MSEYVMLYISMALLVGLIYSSGYYLAIIKPRLTDKKRRFQAFIIALLITSFTAPVTLGEVIYQKLKGGSIYEN